MPDRTPPSTGIGILAILMMIAGGLIALFAGGCSILVLGSVLVTIVRQRFHPDSLGVLVGMLPLTAIGLAIAWTGLRLVRAGLEKWRGAS